MDTSAIRARWDFLQSLHPLFLFSKSLPTVEAADEGRYGDVNDEGASASFKNAITMLRNDMKLNIIKQQLADFDQLLNENDPVTLEELDDQLNLMLGTLEGLVAGQVFRLEEMTVDVNSLSSFPKLVNLRGLLRKYDGIGLTNLDDVENDEFLGEKEDIHLATETSWSHKFSHTSLSRAANCVQFPQDVDEIEACRRAVSSFGRALEGIFGDSLGRLKTEAQTQYYSPQEVAAVQDAHGFASACTSLYEQLVESIECGTEHQSRIHLSGFQGDRMRVDIGTCPGGGWISASFVRSLNDSTREVVKFWNMCQQSTSPPLASHIMHVTFNSIGMWEEPVEDGTLYPITGESAVLDELLGHKLPLRLMHRRLIGVFLASSLFRLCDSPWIQQCNPGSIYLSLPVSNKHLHSWWPQVLCTLKPAVSTNLNSDTIAAFGVLLMELENNDKALWTDDDVDWLSEVKSNHVRLARVLKEWEEDVSDEYREVARACLEFDSLVENLDHPDIDADLKCPAVIYKCILDPLFRYLMKSSGKTASIFEGMFGPWHSLTAAMRLTPSDAAKRVLFDDVPVRNLPERIEYANNFLKDLQPLFARILDLRSAGGPVVALAKSPTYERVRIAVLDSGVDSMDSKIRGATKWERINAQKSRSFVGPSADYQDTYGHGTHVARLLLQVAPAAEIFVAKVCIGKSINEEFMPGIAEAIDWAVETCNAHIISMSFGFEDENELIDAAVERATQAGKLVFAAASNNGGIRGRARPARNEDVFCIHATDGLGNKGEMNPSPLEDTANFSTLGVAVPSKWKGADVWKSGTSFATPIAAGFAADVLEFANHRCNLTPGKQKVLYRKRGMQALFRKMSEKRGDGYDFVHPGRLWQDGKSDKEVAKTIEDIIRAL